MSDVPPLGRRTIEPPIGADLAAWAASEITKHEELCGLRYESIAKDMAAMKAAFDDAMKAANARTAAIENKISGAIKWVMGIVGSLAVALVLMSLNDQHSRTQADESDKREMRARLSLLTQQLANVQPHAVVLTPPGTQTTQIGPATVNTPPLDAEDLSDASGGKAGAGK